MNNKQKQDLLRMLPGIDSILDAAHQDPLFEDIPKPILVRSARSVVDKIRTEIMETDQAVDKKELAIENILGCIHHQVREILSSNLVRTINATGVVVHTNLGRSLLSAPAIQNLVLIAGRYSNLEFNLKTGKRGSRYEIVEDILCEISGAESAMVVNNNAGAVLLCLETMAKGKKVIVSRGELVEIGGSFRIPDVMKKSGALLKEVGTTNRTHVQDYINAVEHDTALLLKVHTSNFSLVGFTADVSLKELSELGEKYHIPVMEDLGSGTFIDFSKYGLTREPTVQESIASGTDIVTFSGDKLLGGPQAGIILGKKIYLDEIKKNPITRALRIDKLTLAALEATLELYRNPEKAVQDIPTLNMLTCSIGDIQKRTKRLQRLLKKLDIPDMHVRVRDLSSKAGGGALPLLNLPSKGIALIFQGMTANAVEEHMRNNAVPIIGRIEDNEFVMDLRTIRDDELTLIVDAVQHMIRAS